MQLHTTESSSVNTIDELATTIRNAHKAAQLAWSNALDHVLDAGDALIKAQTRVSSNWKRWVKDNCFLSVSTAMLYMQLARHRAEIEAEISRVGELSLRAAVRLVSKPDDKAPPKPKKLKPELLVAWRRASNAERTEALNEIPLIDFLAAMPAAWLVELKARGVRLDGGRAGEPDPRISKILRAALSHVASADQPETGKPAAQGQEHAALAGLRALNTALRALGRDLHDVEVSLVVKPERSSKRRRAA